MIGYKSVGRRKQLIRPIGFIIRLRAKRARKKAEIPEKMNEFIFEGYPCLFFVPGIYGEAFQMAGGSGFPRMERIIAGRSAESMRHMPRK
ncbi:MAG: hypothetical protein IKP32_03130 [Clostridia bacterium]|nr:hypothetical protein [Clostridia bacterium]